MDGNFFAFGAGCPADGRRVRGVLCIRGVLPRGGGELEAQRPQGVGQEGGGCVGVAALEFEPGDVPAAAFQEGFVVLHLGVAEIGR